MQRPQCASIPGCKLGLVWFIWENALGGKRRLLGHTGGDPGVATYMSFQPSSGVGLLVQPRPGRAVLMHQDVLHRLSTPSQTAHRPRYSLVWKLLFLPKKEDDKEVETEVRERETVLRREWGVPLRLGGGVS